MLDFFETNKWLEAIAESVAPIIKLRKKGYKVTAELLKVINGTAHVQFHYCIDVKHSHWVSDPNQDWEGLGASPHGRTEYYTEQEYFEFSINLPVLCGIETAYKLVDDRYAELARQDKIAKVKESIANHTKTLEALTKELAELEAK